MKNLYYLLLALLIVTSCKKEEPEPTSTSTTSGQTVSTVQNLLNNGSTPIDLFNQGYLLSEIYCNEFESGYIFYLDTISGEGLVCADTDFAFGLEWDPTGSGPGQEFTYVFLGVTDSTLWTGQANTTTIASMRPTSPAAIVENLTHDGYSDWFLPSRDEAQLLFNVLGVDGCNLLPVSGDIYWTSTEFDNARAFRLINYTGVGLSLYYKWWDSSRARPVRKF